MKCDYLIYLVGADGTEQPAAFVVLAACAADAHAMALAEVGLNPGESFRVVAEGDMTEADWRATAFIADDLGVAVLPKPDATNWPPEGGYDTGAVRKSS